ncbi:hypothetical protein HPB50_002486 [Hyalomma asiaticum]|uniref:Uncharacterized protein n=1 Tax=Hyalomma asiaticum TaxID=266040 RepID=A0ACB7SME6_HYAAI|nr:hypothetical protein HPB50_002486 [Hyalomma asiaticum]
MDKAAERRARRAAAARARRSDLAVRAREAEASRDSARRRCEDPAVRALTLLTSFIESMMTLALMFALGALVLLSVVLMRYMLRFEIIFLLGAFILEAITAVPVFLSVAVFGGMCFDRSWLQYPNYNHLSWAYALAVVAFFFHTLAAVMLLGETFKARERRRRANNLIYNMQPRS